LNSSTIAIALQDYQRAITNDSFRQVGASVNTALAKLAVELCQAAIRECDHEIQLDSYFTLSYLVKGFAYLWSLNEDRGVHTCNEVLTHGGLISFF
jgi:hypothetical protein